MLFIIFTIGYFLTSIMYLVSDIWKHNKSMFLLASVINIGGFIWLLLIKSSQPELFESVKYWISFLPEITLFIFIISKVKGCLDILSDIFDAVT